MSKNYWMLLALVFILPAMLFSVSCAKKAVETEPAVTTPAPEEPKKPMQAEPQQQPEPAKPATNEEAMAAVKAREAALAERNQFMNEVVYFDFDSSSLLPVAQQVIADKVDYMMANPGVTVTIEGHCDERGTNEYNLALGEARAQSTKNYLVDLGVSADRIGTISYGEERPIATGDTPLRARGSGTCPRHRSTWKRRRSACARCAGRWRECRAARMFREC